MFLFSRRNCKLRLHGEIPSSRIPNSRFGKKKKKEKEKEKNNKLLVLVDSSLFNFISPVVFVLFVFFNF